MAQEDRPVTRELFSQSCQMYRHFVTLRYYNYSVGGAITAGLLTLFFQKGTLTPEAANVVRACGVLLQFIIVLIDARISVLVSFYYHCMKVYASQLDGRESNPIGMNIMAHWFGIWFTTILVGCLCAFCSFAWIFLAKPPAGH